MVHTLLPIITSVAAGAILLVATRLIFDKFLLKHKNNINLKFLRSIINTLIIVICIYGCLGQFEFTKDISRSVFQSSSLIIAVLTFAAQKTLGNVISGFSISISKPFEVGQKIKVLNGNTVIVEGYITDITIRHTVIRQYDGQSCIVPNSTMDTSVIINSNYEGDIGNFLEVEISYESDINRAIAIFHDICMGEQLCVNKGKTAILVSRMTQNGVVLKTTIWTETLNDNFIACSRIRKALIRQFRKHGIVIPYQTLRIAGSEKGGTAEEPGGNAFRADSPSFSHIHSLSNEDSPSDRID